MIANDIISVGMAGNTNKILVWLGSFTYASIFSVKNIDGVCVGDTVVGMFVGGLVSPITVGLAVNGDCVGGFVGKFVGLFVGASVMGLGNNSVPHSLSHW